LSVKLGSRVFCDDRFCRCEPHMWIAARPLCVPARAGGIASRRWLRCSWPLASFAVRTGADLDHGRPDCSGVRPSDWRLIVDSQFCGSSECRSRLRPVGHIDGEANSSGFTVHAGAALRHYR
jgi:hypothetical protein